MIFKKNNGHFIIVLLLNFLFYSSTFAFVGEKVGLDLFKTIDSTNVTYKEKLITQSLKGKSASNINSFVGAKFGGKSFFDISNDFTLEELDSIREDENISVIYSHLKNEYRIGKDMINTEQISTIKNLIVDRYSSQESENNKLLSSMAKVGSVGLYNDGDEKNSGYDILYDIEQIHKVVFTKKTKYEGETNNSSDDFDSGLSGGFGDLSSVFDPEKNNFNSGLSGSLLNKSKDNSGSIAEIINDINKKLPPTSNNLCNTGTDIIGLGDDFLYDLNNEITKGNSANNTVGGINNSNNNYTDNSDNSGNSTNNNSGNSGGGSSGGGSIFDSFPCSGFFCIDISTIMYSQKLLGGGDSSIEGILDKNTKIIDKYAGKSLVQSKFTYEFFELSILKDLNLPSMLHLGIVVTHLPPPILNLEPKNSNSKDLAGIKNDDILVDSFAQYGLNYKKQNYFNPDYEYKNISDCTFKTTAFCNSKLIATQESYQPETDYSSIYHSKLENIYRSGIGDDIAQFYGFSYTFQHSIDAMVGTIKKLKEKCK